MDVWEIPFRAPITADKTIEAKKIFINVVLKDDISKIKGAIFCHERTIKAHVQFIPSTTWGSQTWKGEAPSLINNLSDKIILSSFDGLVKKNWYILKKAEKIKIAEANAWTRKYFNDASEFRGDLSLKERAKRDKILISRAIHAVNQEEAETAKIVLDTKKNKNINFQGIIKIKRRIIPYLGYEPKSLI